MHDPTDRIVHTTSFYIASHGALAGMRNNSMGPMTHHTISRHSTVELHLNSETDGQTGK